MSEYAYSPIDLSQPAFRLVRLLSGSGSLHCSIFLAFLNQPSSIIPYDALSYTWGSAVTTNSITIDGRRLKITQNLYLALMYLRWMDEDRILWVDGLCIDQGNDREKGHQVQQMGNIYRCAERVVIWLGIGTDETDMLMDTIKRFEGERNRLNSSTNYWRDIRPDIQPNLRIKHSSLDIGQQRGLDYIFGQPWFRRVWILQEVANARAAVIVCGRKSVSARIFATIPPLLRFTPDPHCQAILDIMPGYSRENSWWSQTRNLSTLLLKFSESEASDPRDKIYALLGLSSDACDTDLLRADYSKPLHTVNNDAASFLFHFPELNSIDLTCNWTLPSIVGAIAFLSDVGPHWERTTGLPAEIRLLLALVRQDVDMNFKPNSDESPLSIAIAMNKRTIVQRFLMRGAINVNAKSGSGTTLLAIAVQHGREEIVQLLLAFDGIDVDCSILGTPLLLFAVQNSAGSAENIVKLLLERKDINVSNSPTLLMEAVGTRSAEIVKLLLAREDLDVNYKTNGENPLWSAVWERNVEIVKLLLAREDLDVNQQTNGETSLSEAMRIGSLEIVELLLARENIDVNAKDGRGHTPLMVALHSKRIDIVRLLLTRDDINLRTKDNFGRTIQQWADNSSVSEIRELLKGALKGVGIGSRLRYWLLRK
ncbi:hypothetical protein EG329_010645 [Mollisiaceae sp. DMI_Dod_QoI]|nr:hypothetical protein EG329_010645 [Helotiales sp. DMI_Dod_QoI]